MAKRRSVAAKARARPHAGNLPRPYDPSTPVTPGAVVPEGQHPVQVEPPSGGLLPDQEISTDPGRPRSSLPEEPGTPITERQRPPRSQTQQRK